MKRIFGILLTLMGVGAVALGLLFLVGADGQIRRLVIAAAALFAGAGGVGLGLKVLRQARAENPEVIASRILALARGSEGEFSRAEVLARVGPHPAQIDAALDALEAKGVCRRTSGGRDPSWVFPAFQTEVLIRRCEFCGQELPLHEQLESCPKCGGSIATGVERLSADGEAPYGMDD